MVPEGENVQSKSEEWADIPHYLFLMEFFVYHINSDRITEMNDMLYTPTSVFFTFPNIDQDDIEVKAVNANFEPISKRNCNNVIEYVNTGKSMLFALSKQQFCDLREFLIYLRLQKNYLNYLNVDIASAGLDFSDQFQTIKQSAAECLQNRTLPDPQTYEGNIPLKYQNNPAGYISVYLRLSALGETVVTEFDNSNVKSASTFIFKSPLISDNIYECHVNNANKGPLCENESNFRIDKYDGQWQQQAMGDSASLPYNQQHLTLSKADCSSCTKTGPIQTSRGMMQPCNNAVVLKMSGLLEDETGGPKIQVASESEAMSPELASKYDVFILRIGKKGIVGPGEKSDLQLELKTPRGPENRPPIRYETRDVQTEEEQKSSKPIKKATKKKRGKQK